MQAFYKRDDDVKTSGRLLLRESSEMEEILYSETPYAIGFVCAHGVDLCEKVRGDEAFIDSTYKTNSSKPELFAVLGSFLGKGFPIAYLLLQEGCGESRTADRKKVIYDFLLALKTRVSSLKPVFFFSDKDFGQIHAIHQVYGIVASLCLWHLKRAVKKKIDELRLRKVEEVTNDQRETILKMMTEHFNSHPFFFPPHSETIRSLYLKNYQEIYEYCRNGQKEFLHAYLYENWYKWERYVM